IRWANSITATRRGQTFWLSENSSTKDCHRVIFFEFSLLPQLHKENAKWKKKIPNQLMLTATRLPVAEAAKNEHQAIRQREAVAVWPHRVIHPPEAVEVNQKKILRP